MYRTLLFLFVSFFVASFGYAEISSPGTGGNRSKEPNYGITEVASGFQVFPAGKPGNSLYQNKEYLFSKPGLVILGVIPSKLGSLVWGENESGKREAHWISKDKSEVDVRAYGESVFFVKLPGGISRLFWVGPKGQAADLLPLSNTAANYASNGTNRGAFSHISGGSKIELENGKVGYQYSFKVHTVDLKTGKVTHHKKVYLSLKPTLKLRWVRDNLLQVAGGQSPPERLTIR